ncbi:MAG TPA: hypothetical protein VIC84_23065 [Blastocatellia bacterium]|jgi:hypothetical protein
MCDYSLHGIKNRLATEGEQLFIHRFPSGSKGLASKADFEAARPGRLKRIAHFLLNPGENFLRGLPAICIPPGAKLRLSGIPQEIRKMFGVGEIEDVTFVQLTAEPFRYRDAFRFANGREILIQKLPEDLRVEVLALELAEPAAAAEEKLAERRMSANV